MQVFEDRKKYKGEVVRYDVRTKWYRIRYGSNCTALRCGEL